MNVNFVCPHKRETVGGRTFNVTTLKTVVKCTSFRIWIYVFYMDSLYEEQQSLHHFNDTVHVYCTMGGQKKVAPHYNTIVVYKRQKVPKQFRNIHRAVQINSK